MSSTEFLHATQDKERIGQVYEDVINGLSRCLPVQGKAPPHFAVVLFYDHDKQEVEITSLNANESEVKDLILDAFKNIFDEKIQELVAQMEAKNSTFN